MTGRAEELRGGKGGGERGGGLTIQILRPGQVDHSVADLSFFSQLAEVVPNAVKVYLLLWGGTTQICISIHLKK